MLAKVRRHGPEYLIEALGVAALVFVICVVSGTVDDPGSSVHRSLQSPFARHAIKALLISVAILGLIHSPGGKRSGAHFNPAVTIAFLRLGKVAPWDAVNYIIAHMVGAVSGAALAAGMLKNLIGDGGLSRSILTASGRMGWFAFGAELFVTFVLMTAILKASNTPRFERFTGLLATGLISVALLTVGLFVGLGINPARALGPSLATSPIIISWAYLMGAPLGMLGAAELHRYMAGSNGTICAKLDHHNDKRCIFKNCGYSKPDGPVPS